MASSEQPRSNSPPASSPDERSAQRLDSWKEIPSHVNRSEKTVRRWEQSEGLPVHRLLHESASLSTLTATNLNPGGMRTMGGSRRWMRNSMTSGRRRISIAPHRTGQGEEDRLATPGSFGSSNGGRPASASTRFGHGHTTSTATFSQCRRTHSSPARGPSGRTTGR
jgi:hypothetical protein